MISLKNKFILSVFLFLLLFYATSVFAQVPPKAKAGVAERGLEKHELKPKETPEDIIIEEEPKRLELPEGRKVLVKEFVFEGNEILDTEFLNILVAPHLNKELSLSELKGVCELIVREYRKRGYLLAKAILPAQEIKDGIVKIVILEGKIGEVEIRGQRFYHDSFIRRNFHPAKNGAIHHSTLLESLLLLNENLDLNVKANLKKGKRPGTTDVILMIEDEFPFDLTVDYNNFGSGFVANHRMGLSTEVGNLLAPGSRLSFRGVGGMGGEELWFSKTGYQFPFNNYGGSLGFSYLRSDFDIGKQYEELSAFGESENYSVHCNQPVIKARDRALDAFLDLEYTQTKDYLEDNVSSKDKIWAVQTGISCNYIDEWQGKNLINSVISVGTVDSDPLVSRAGASGNFAKLNLDFVRMQKLPLPSWFLLLRTSGQVATNALPVSEQFYIGGGDNVRGYPIAEYLGDHGYFGSLELRTPPPFLSDQNVPLAKEKKFRECLQLAGFMDFGQTFLMNRQLGEHNHNEIAGAGVGLRLDAFDCNVTADWGFRIAGEDPSHGADSVFYIRVDKKIF